MKVAFVAHRANYLKHYGPIMDAALERGWQVECWLQDAPMGQKEYLRLTPQMIVDVWGEQVTVRTFGPPSQVEQLNAEVRPDAIVSLYTRSTYTSQPGNECFITLQHSIDLFATSTIEELASSDYVCLNSPYWWDYALQYYALTVGASAEDVERKLRSKVVYTGFAQMDAFATIERAAVRQRWGIPQDKRLVLALPLDVAGWPGAWPHFFQRTGLAQWHALWKARKEPGFVSQYWRWALHGWNDARLAQAVKDFADNNNAVLLLKGREKDPVRQAWSRHAFRSFYDEEHYPPTVFQAIAAADLCIVFYSTAVQEAAYVGVPTLCIDRPNKDTVKHNLWRRAAQGGPYNYPGIVTWQRLPDSIEKLSSMRLSDFAVDEAARHAYLELYNGPADHQASQRILDLVNT